MKRKEGFFSRKGRRGSFLLKNEKKKKSKKYDATLLDFFVRSDQSFSFELCSLLKQTQTHAHAETHTHASRRREGPGREASREREMGAKTEVKVRSLFLSFFFVCF